MTRALSRNSYRTAQGLSLRFLLFSLLLLPGAAAAQDQEGFKNLQVLSEDISRERLMSVMRGFSRSTGMRCATCHVGEEGSPLSTYDFAADDKSAKLKAREMMRMVQAINGTYLADLPGRREPNVGVTCATCHRGISRPEAIESLIGRLATEEDVDFAVERYRTLRERYHGSAAYDFSERPLLSVSDALAGSDDVGAALQILALNLEFHPESAQTMFAMARLHEEAGDVQEAVDLYRRGLEIMPDNRQARERLSALTGGA